MKAAEREAQAARVSAAKTDLVLGHPFFGVLVLAAPIDPSDAIPTAATDGVRILYNPSFIAGLTSAELLGVLAHEVLHCACGHPWRRDQRDPHGWNIACDLAINQIILAAGLSLPKGHLTATAAMMGKSAEWIYDYPQPKASAGGVAGLRSQIAKALQSAPGAPGCGGDDVLDGAADQAATAQGAWAQRLRQAAETARAYGALPDGCERFVDEVTRPKIDWRATLRRFVQASARDDYAWSTPNRRYCSSGLYLPSLRSEHVGPVAVVIDTSGSIDGPVLSQFAAELSAIIEDVRPARTHVVYCDAAVHGIDTYEPDEPVTLTPKGGGGTAFGPALDAIDAFADPPCCVVYLTDLYGSHRTQPPAMPLLWVTTGSSEAPYGEVVMLE